MTESLIVLKPDTEYYVPANPDMLAIARLYLEKYEMLVEEDRKLYRECIALFNAGRTQILTGPHVPESESFRG